MEGSEVSMSNKIKVEAKRPHRLQHLNDWISRALFRLFFIDIG